MVKQLETELRSFKDAPGTHRSSSPPIPTRSNFVFQPLDEYPSASSAPGASPFDDPDVWRPPSRDQQGRRSGTGRVAGGGNRRSSNDGAWARGGTGTNRVGTGGTRGGKSGGTGTGKGATGTRSSNVGGTSAKKGKGNSSKGDSQVIFVYIYVFFFLISTR